MKFSGSFRYLLLAGLLSCCTNILFSQDTLRVDAPRGYPVSPFGDTLFYLSHFSGPLSPAERAMRIDKIAKHLAKSGNPDDRRLAIDTSENYCMVRYPEGVLFSITNNDTIGTGYSRIELATSHMEALQNALDEYARTHTLEWFAGNLLVGLLIFLVIWLCFKLTDLLFNRIERRVKIYQSDLEKRLSPTKKAFFSQELIGFAFSRLFQLIKWIFFAISSYVSLLFLFRVFPRTKSLGDKMINLALEPLSSIFYSVVRYLPDLMTILVIYAVFAFVIRGFFVFAKQVHQGNVHISGFQNDWALPTFQIIRFLLYSFFFVVIFPYLPGSNSPAFQGVTVFIGLLFSLGSTSAIGNIVSGVVLTYMGAFREKDVVRIGEQLGQVIDKTLLVTRIRTVYNEIITIPNQSVLSSFTYNYTSMTRENGLIIRTAITIGYDAPWRKVHELLVNAATDTPGVLSSPAPFVVQTSLDDFYITYEINAYITDALRMRLIKSEIHQKIQDKFNEAGVEIMSPHYSQLRDGNTVTIPGEYLPDDYKPGALRINREPK